MVRGNPGSTHQLREVGSWNPVLYQGFSTIQTVVAWDFWTINSIINGPQTMHDFYCQITYDTPGSHCHHSGKTVVSKPLLWKMGEIRQPTGGRSDFQGKDELYLRRVYIQCGFLINGNLTIYSIYIYIPIWCIYIIGICSWDLMLLESYTCSETGQLYSCNLMENAASLKARTTTPGILTWHILPINYLTKGIEIRRGRLCL